MRGARIPLPPRCACDWADWAPRSCREDSEDSNAEDYFANDYPDEDEGEESGDEDPLLPGDGRWQGDVAAVPGGATEWLDSLVHGGRRPWSQRSHPSEGPTSDSDGADDSDSEGGVGWRRGTWTAGFDLGGEDGDEEGEGEEGEDEDAG